MITSNTQIPNTQTFRLVTLKNVSSAFILASSCSWVVAVSSASTGTVLITFRSDSVDAANLANSISLNLLVAMKRRARESVSMVSLNAWLRMSLLTTAIRASTKRQYSIFSAKLPSLGSDVVLIA